MDPKEVLGQLEPVVSFQVGSLMMTICGLLAVWVAMDARDRGWTRLASLAWGVGVILVNWPLVILYLVVRMSRPVPKQVTATEDAVTQTCRYCGQTITGDPAYCPHCSNQLKSASEIHRN